jgi:hypothetical protein
MSRAWTVLKLLRDCTRCGAKNVRMFASAVSGERRCTECVEVETIPTLDDSRQFAIDHLKAIARRGSQRALDALSTARASSSVVEQSGRASMSDQVEFARAGKDSRFEGEDGG